VCGFEIDEQTAIEGREWLIAMGGMTLGETLDMRKEGDGKL
jgi:hypothetical protein